MTKIQKVLRDIRNLQDFYKRTQSLRTRLKKKGLERLKTEQADASGSENQRPSEDTLH